MKTIQAVRGMNDILPSDIACWQWVESCIANVMASYGYQEIRFPIVEDLSLFKRSVGEVTDIVEKEMYSFEDKNGDVLALRPEGTAGCVRAGIEHGLLYNQIQRWWYQGPMFRHERPQKGRYRQFHQIGAECFGITGPEADAELIFISDRLWKELRIQNKLKLEINSLGSPTARKQYREVLIDYFSEHATKLDEDSKRRLTSNPLRILDSKNPEMKELLENAPLITDHLDDASKKQLDDLRALLDKREISYEVNPRLVRGLDYYTGIVFEWITDTLGAQGAVCSGGRYDNLVETLGGKSTAGVGFAIGLERLVYMVEENQPAVHSVDVALLCCGVQAQSLGLELAESIRDDFPNLKLITLCGNKFKSLMKRADTSGATLALILGDDEVAAKTVAVKYLREEKPQEALSKEALTEFFKNVEFKE